MTETTEHGGILQKGGGPYEYTFPAGGTTRYPAPTFTDPNADPFVFGGTVERRKGVEVDWDLLKEWAWEDRFILSVSIMAGCVLGAALYDPSKYAPLVDALGRAISESVKGIGEVIPG